MAFSGSFIFFGGFGGGGGEALRLLVDDPILVGEDGPLALPV